MDRVDMRFNFVLILLSIFVAYVCVVRIYLPARRAVEDRLRRLSREDSYAVFDSRIRNLESDFMFRRLFRMSKACFDSLLDVLCRDARMIGVGEYGHDARRKVRANV